MTGQMHSRFKPRYDKGLWAVFILLLLLPLGRAGFLVAADEFQRAWLMLGVTEIALLALWSGLPRAFELWPDRIRIALGWRWGLNIPLITIEEVMPAPGVAAWFRLGAMFATSFKTPVQIKRTKGMTIVLSPDNLEEFIGCVRKALATAPGEGHQARPFEQLPVGGPPRGGTSKRSLMVAWLYLPYLRPGSKLNVTSAVLQGTDPTTGDHRPSPRGLRRLASSRHCRGRPFLTLETGGETTALRR